MKKQLLLCAVLGVVMACQQEGNIDPASPSLAASVAGTYRTNLYMDPSYVALPANQMPYAELKAESDSSVLFVYTEQYPTKSSQTVSHIQLVRRPDGIQLRVGGLTIGTFKTDRIFTNNGMEKQGPLLRITLGKSLNFTGIR